MAEIKDHGFQVPYREQVLSKDGILSFSWQNFFKTLYLYVSSLGIERSSKIINNAGSYQNIEGMQFDSNKLAHAIVDFVIHRVTSTTELVESGSLHVVYRPKVKTWSVYRTTPVSQPHDAGISFGVTSAGQVQHMSTNVTGTEYLSKITWRARTLGAKGYQAIAGLVA